MAKSGSLEEWKDGMLEVVEGKLEGWKVESGKL